VRLYGLTWMPHQLRAHAVDALLADANESLTTFLRKHIRVEGTTGPRLPGVVVFAHRRASEELGKDEALSFFRDAVSVEEALGAYRSNGVTLLVPRFSWAATRVSSQRVAVSIPELLDSRNTEGYATEEDAVELGLRDSIGSLAVVVALQDFIAKLEAYVVALRQALTPQLGGRERTLRRSFAWAFSDMDQLNRLAFETSRVESEIDWALLDSMTLQHLSQFWTPADGFTNVHRFIDSRSSEFRFRWGHLMKQVGVLREAFRNRLDYRLQRIVFMLTCVGVLLAAISVLEILTEEARKELWRWFWDHARQVVRWLSGVDTLD